MSQVGAHDADVAVQYKLAEGATTVFPSDFSASVFPPEQGLGLQIPWRVLSDFINAVFKAFCSYIAGWVAVCTQRS